MLYCLLNCVPIDGRFTPEEMIHSYVIWPCPSTITAREALICPPSGLQSNAVGTARRANNSLASVSSDKSHLKHNDGRSARPAPPLGRQTVHGECVLSVEPGRGGVGRDRSAGPGLTPVQ